MFVLRSSISVKVSKEIFGIINKRGEAPNKHWWWRDRCWKKIEKITSKGGDVYLAIKSTVVYTYQSVKWRCVEPNPVTKPFTFKKSLSLLLYLLV